MSCISNVNNKPSITYTNRIFDLLKATSFLLSYGLNRSNEFGFPLPCSIFSSLRSSQGVKSSQIADSSTEASKKSTYGNKREGEVQ